MMSKILKIVFIFIFLCFLYIGVSKAETTNLYNDVVNENTSNATTNSTNEEETAQNNTTNQSVLEDDLLEDTEDANGFIGWMRRQ